jgi:hypothetical protein
LAELGRDAEPDAEPLPPLLDPASLSPSLPEPSLPEPSLPEPETEAVCSEALYEYCEPLSLPASLPRRPLLPE